MKGLLRTMKENEDFNSVLNQALKRDLKHDSKESGYESLNLGASPRASVAEIVGEAL